MQNTFHHTLMFSKTATTLLPLLKRSSISALHNRPYSVSQQLFKHAPQLIALSVKAHANLLQLRARRIFYGTCFVQLFLNHLHDHLFVVGVFDHFGQGRVSRPSLTVKPAKILSMAVASLCSCINSRRKALRRECPAVLFLWKYWK